MAALMEAAGVPQAEIDALRAQRDGPPPVSAVPDRELSDWDLLRHGCRHRMRPWRTGS
jgi:hypothetical protein